METISKGMARRMERNIRREGDDDIVKEDIFDGSKQVVEEVGTKGWRAG